MSLMQTYLIKMLYQNKTIRTSIELHYKPYHERFRLVDRYVIKYDNDILLPKSFGTFKHAEEFIYSNYYVLTKEIPNNDTGTSTDESN